MSLILQDPLLNFLELLVGVVAGHTMRRMDRALTRRHTWPPLGVALFALALALTIGCLEFALGLYQQQIAVAPLCVGVGLYWLMVGGISCSPCTAGDHSKPKAACRNEGGAEQGASLTAPADSDDGDSHLPSITT